MARLKVTQIFFYKCFNLCVTFSSMIYFELIYIIWDMRYVSGLFIYDNVQLNDYSLFIVLPLCLHQKLVDCLCGSLPGLSTLSTLLIFVSILLLTPNCLDQRIFKVSLSIGQCTFCNLSFVFRIFLAIILLCLAV